MNVIRPFLDLEIHIERTQQLELEGVILGQVLPELSIRPVKMQEPSCLRYFIHPYPHDTPFSFYESP